MGEGRREVGTLFSTVCMTVPIGGRGKEGSRNSVQHRVYDCTNRKEGEWGREGGK